MIIDVHAHVLPAIDDGAADINVSLDMLRMAQEDGITHVVTTPHYIHGSLNNNASFVHEKCAELSKLSKKAGIDINLFPGNEVFICPELPQLLEEGQICSLNDSSYVLMELPMMSIPDYVEDVIYQLRLKGYTPVIAHPERNMQIFSNPNILHGYIERGALSQINSTSLNGLYGMRIKDLSIQLLRHGMVHFVASDAHTCRGRSLKLMEVKEQVKTEFGDDFTRKIFEENGQSVLSNKYIEIELPTKLKEQKTFLIPLLKKYKYGVMHKLRYHLVPLIKKLKPNREPEKKEL